VLVRDPSKKRCNATEVAEQLLERKKKKKDHKEKLKRGRGEHISGAKENHIYLGNSRTHWEKFEEREIAH